MKTEKKILQVIAEQKEYIKELHIEKLVSRKEENLFEFDSSLAQVVIGVRRSGKSTICHKVLLEKNIEYAYVNFDDAVFFCKNTKFLELFIRSVTTMVIKENIITAVI